MRSTYSLRSMRSARSTAGVIVALLAAVGLTACGTATHTTGSGPAPGSGRRTGRTAVQSAPDAIAPSNASALVHPVLTAPAPDAQAAIPDDLNRTGFANVAPRNSFAAADTAATPLLKLPPTGTPVKVQGTTNNGMQVTVDAERLADGSIAFIDATSPGADRTTGKGLIVVYDGANAAKSEDLPGPIATMREGDAPDPDVITASWSARVTLDYFRTTHGIDSFDGSGAPILTVVHVPQSIIGCTQRFRSEMFQATGRCTLDDGTEILKSAVDVGMTAYLFADRYLGLTTPNLFDTTSQGGAVVIGTNDYFSVLVQNRALGTTSVSVGATRCQGAPDSYMCTRFSDGSAGYREVDTGLILEDAVFDLREPRGNLDRVYSSGGTFDNAMVWSSALWQIRKAFASEDGGNLVTSAAADRFDRIVFRAATTYYSDDTDLATAAAAVAQAAIDLQATADEQSVIQQQFVISELCEGCIASPDVQHAVAATPRIEHRPQAVDGGVVYLAAEGGASPRTVAVFAPGGDPAKAVTLTPAGVGTFQVAAAADLVVETRYELTSGNWQGIFMRRLGSDTVERLDDYAAYAEPAVSAATVVWAKSATDGYLIRARATAGGAVTSIKVTSRPIQLAVDGPLVAYQTQDGTLGTWNIQTGATQILSHEPALPDAYLFSLGRMPGKLAVFGNRVASLTPQDTYAPPNTVQIFDATTGIGSVISKNAFPGGLAMNGDLLVWSEVVGNQPSPISAIVGTQTGDSDLMAYSFASGSFAILLQERGQQGFPSIGGGQLAWQDSVNLSDDIYSAGLPSGL